MDVFSFLSYQVEQEHEALEKLFDQLDDEKLQQPLIAGAGENEDTIGQRLSHTIGAEYRMATYLYQDEGDIEEFKVSPTSLEDIRLQANVSMGRHLLTLQQLQEEDLNKVWTSQVSGNSYDYKFLLWHFIEHLATHRGQVAMAINRL